MPLVGPGIRLHNGQREDFTREPPSCLLRSMFGVSVNGKPPPTSVFFQRVAFTHILA